MSAQKQPVPRLSHHFPRPLHQCGQVKRAEAKVLPQIADSGNTSDTSSRSITTTICKRCKRSRRGFYSIFLLRKIRVHNDTIGHYRARKRMSLAAICMGWPKLRRMLPCACVLLFATAAKGQIQVDLKFKRLQYIAYEPVVATLAITNLAGRDIELHDANGQSWLGFEVTGNDDQPTALLSTENAQPPLKIEAGQRVTRQIDLGPLYSVHDFGAYHVRTHVYFADLAKFFYSPTRVFEVTDARPIWQQTVGIPGGVAASGEVQIGRASCRERGDVA